MPVLVLLTGAAGMNWLEYRLQVRDLHKVLLTFVGLGTFTGGVTVLTTRLFWGWWK